MMALYLKCGMDAILHEWRSFDWEWSGCYRADLDALQQLLRDDYML